MNVKACGLVENNIIGTNLNTLNKMQKIIEHLTMAEKPYIYLDLFISVHNEIDS